MGSVKELLLRTREQDRLLEANGETACGSCFLDVDLRAYVKSHGAAGRCTFCKRKRPAVVNFADIASHIQRCVHQEYSDPNDWFVWDSREGGLQGPSKSTYDLLDEVEIVASDTSIYHALVEILGDDACWCEANPFSGSLSEQLTTGWDAFADLVKTKRRYFFREEKVEPGSLSPEQLLRTISRFVDEQHLYKEVAAGTEFFRVRVVKSTDGPPSTPKDFGPPPAGKAFQSNRMNAPGIPVLYASSDELTALKETGRRKHAYVGRLMLTRAARLIDLSSIPVAPGVFAERRSNREELIFLRDFAREIARPVVRDDRVHVEYVPTQVVTEFLRMTFAKDIDGILYKSAQRRAGRNVAFFCGAEAMFDEESPESTGWIRLVETRSARGAWPAESLSLSQGATG